LGSELRFSGFQSFDYVTQIVRIHPQVRGNSGVLWRRLRYWGLWGQSSDSQVFSLLITETLGSELIFLGFRRRKENRSHFILSPCPFLIGRVSSKLPRRLRLTNYFSIYSGFYNSLDTFLAMRCEPGSLLLTLSSFNSRPREPGPRTGPSNPRSSKDWPILLRIRGTPVGSDPAF